MKTRMTTVVVGLTLLGFATGAVAQERPSRREESYGRDLARSLGQQPGTVKRVEFAHGPSAVGRIDDLSVAGPGRGAPTRRTPDPVVKGVSVEMDGLTVERLRFETPEQAQQHAAWLLNGDVDTRRPVTAQVRGNQLVLVQGDAAGDPAAAERLTAAAWKGLPAPAGEADASFTQLADGSTALTTTLQDGPLREELEKALATARKTEPTLRDTPESGNSITTTPTSADVAFASGTRIHLQVDDQGGSLSVARTPEGAEAMKEHLSALGGHPGGRIASATEGQAKVIEDLFSGFDR